MNFAENILVYLAPAVRELASQQIADLLINLIAYVEGKDTSFNDEVTKAYFSIIKSVIDFEYSKEEMEYKVLDREKEEEDERERKDYLSKVRREAVRKRWDRSTVTDTKSYKIIQNDTKSYKTDTKSYKTDTNAIQMHGSEEKEQSLFPPITPIDSKKIEESKEQKEITTKVVTKKKRNETVADNPPSIEEVAAYCAERKNGIDAEYFINRNASVGWKDKQGRDYTNWKGVVVTWEKYGYGKRPRSPAQPVLQVNDFNHDEIADLLDE